MVRALLVIALLAGCDGEPGRFDDANTCAELLAAFEAHPVSDDAQERKEVGDEYRARFIELDCEL